jgi:tRNA U34 2-thiouridine synthase MnmA/TrmU
LFSLKSFQTLSTLCALLRRSWILWVAFVPVARAEVKVRYRSPAIGADVEQTPRGFRLHLAEPAYGVARGQTAVLYEDDVVVGCGLVSSSTRST